MNPDATTYKEGLLWLAERFPTLRRECEGPCQAQSTFPQASRCPDCHGRRWVPVDDLKVILEAARQAGYYILIRPTGRDYEAFCKGKYDWGDKAEEAAILAFYKAVEEEKP